jgi:hypothetical protein
VPPAQPDDVLGLAVVKEGEDDDIGHWVVFIGKNQLKDTGISCEDDWNGIVLDSDRGYERWRIGTDRKTQLRQLAISIQRDAKHTVTRVEWIYSFVSLSLD